MDLSGILGELKLDVWYKVPVYLGGVLLAVSLLVDVKGVTNGQLQLLAGGVLLFGLGEWKNHKVAVWVKPPNAYTGPATLIQAPTRRPDVFGIALDLAGLILVALGILSIVGVI